MKYGFNYMNARQRENPNGWKKKRKPSSWKKPPRQRKFQNGAGSGGGGRKSDADVVFVNALRVCLGLEPLYGKPESYDGPPIYRVEKSSAGGSRYEAMK